MTDPALSSEDAVVVAEVLRRIYGVIGALRLRADGSINHRDLYDALGEEYERAKEEAGRG